MTSLTIGCALKRARKSAGISLSSAARETGMSKSHLFGIEGDESVPGLLIAARLGRLYGISLDSLIAETNALGADVEALEEGPPS